MSTGMAGVGFFDTGHRTPRTRDWSRADDSQRANPARPETPEEKRKREWDESCRKETLRLQALAEEGRRKREAEQRRFQEDERKKQEAARKQQELPATSCNVRFRRRNDDSDFRSCCSSTNVNAET